MDSHWITVLGFHAEALAAVLSEMQPSTGAMLEHIQAGPNWAHVRCVALHARRLWPPSPGTSHRARHTSAPASFATRFDKEEALTKNGRIVGGLMIGMLTGRHPSPTVGADLGQKGSTSWVLPAKPAMPEAFSQARNAGRTIPQAPNQRPGRIASLWTRISEYILGW